jgi:hypothetical protein
MGLLHTLTNTLSGVKINLFVHKSEGCRMVLGENGCVAASFSHFMWATASRRSKSPHLLVFAFCG